MYDEKVALLVSDYVSLTNTLMDLCERLLITNNDEVNTPISQIRLARQLLATGENDRSASKSKLDNILINLIKEKENDKEGNSENVISRILGQNASSYHRSGKNRKYRDLLRGTFNVEVTRIERQDDPNTISGKIGDFSHTTITDLMQKGEEETKIYLNESK